MVLFVQARVDIKICWLKYFKNSGYIYVSWLCFPTKFRFMWFFKLLAKRFSLFSFLLKSLLYLQLYSLFIFNILIFSLLYFIIDESIQNLLSFSILQRFNFEHCWLTWNTLSVSLIFVLVFINYFSLDSWNLLCRVFFRKRFLD